jgi:Prokaryotic RING finger family 1
MITQAQQAHAVCAICQSPFGPDDAATMCPACGAPYHADCWSDNGGCAVYGCRLVPNTEGLKPLEIPPAFWGREDKSCPACNALIAAMAVRCRHCGAAIEARPEEKTSYDRRQARRQRAPALRRNAVLLIVASLIPVLAALAAIFGWMYYRHNHDEIRRLPGSAEGLYRIAIGVAAAQSVIIALALVGFWIRGTLG